MSARLRTIRWLAGSLLATVGAAAAAQQAPPAQAPTATRNGRDIYAEFRAGLGMWNV